jgi:hypothetical protein
MDLDILKNGNKLRMAKQNIFENTKMSRKISQQTFLFQGFSI